MSATTRDPIPVRALNQVTYCPRLYYLQYVDCVMVRNEHVEPRAHAAQNVAPRSREVHRAHTTDGTDADDCDHSQIVTGHRQLFTFAKFFY